MIAAHRQTDTDIPACVYLPATRPVIRGHLGGAHLFLTGDRSHLCLNQRTRYICMHCIDGARARAAEHMQMHTGVGTMQDGCNKDQPLFAICSSSSSSAFIAASSPPSVFPCPSFCCLLNTPRLRLLALLRLGIVGGPGFFVGFVSVPFARGRLGPICRSISIDDCHESAPSSAPRVAKAHYGRTDLESGLMLRCSSFYLAYPV